MYMVLVGNKGIHYMGIIYMCVWIIPLFFTNPREIIQPDIRSCLFLVYLAHTTLARKLDPFYISYKDSHMPKN